MEKVPSNIDFTRKLPKASKEFDKMNERSLEALACPIWHAGMTKFWALHPKTIGPWKHACRHGMGGL